MVHHNSIFIKIFMPLTETCNYLHQKNTFKISANSTFVYMLAPLVSGGLTFHMELQDTVATSPVALR